MRVILILLLLSGCTSTMVEDDGESTLKILSKDGSLLIEGSLEDHRGDNLMEAPELPTSYHAPFIEEGDLNRVRS